MKILRFIRLSVARALNAWALREIDLMHPDLPKLVLEQRDLEDQVRRLFA